ncbi:conserved Plasmodium protein, unknown function [Plasmodium gonderi]|uniref:Uncharacterized protein n=1 Tax=Plasmodium gonderi TaxID=77519 RepID=A0A1Y1JN50_PLAGO|nr:conserved Plasmodium protein, unknown function [Plasmodium gonderi]GAW82968.1 conserved Plasmodium protein, unknown function [Plasmodium gonderi]
MNQEKDEKFFNEKLQEELQRLREYPIIQGILAPHFNTEKKAKRKIKNKVGYLYKLIESHCVNKIICDFLFHKKCGKRYIKVYPTIPFFSVKKKVEIKKKSKELVVTLTDNIPFKISFLLINRDKDFFIFLKITHYVKKESLNKLGNSSLSPFLIFAYDEYVRSLLHGHNQYEEKWNHEICTPGISKKCVCPNGGISSLPELVKLDEEKGSLVCSIRGDYHKESENKCEAFSRRGATILKKKKSIKKGDAKKFVDHHLLLINYRNCNKVTYTTFLDQLAIAIFKHFSLVENSNIFREISTNSNVKGDQHTNHNHDGEEKIAPPLETSNRRSSKPRGEKNVNQISPLHKKSSGSTPQNDRTNKTFQSKMGSLSVDKNGNKHCAKTARKLKTNIFLKVRKKNYKICSSHSSFLSSQTGQIGQTGITDQIDQTGQSENKANSFFSLSEAQGVQQIPHLLAEQNCRIYIYTNKIEKEKEIFLTFHSRTKCFFVFISPFLAYINARNSEIICLHHMGCGKNSYNTFKEQTMENTWMKAMYHEITHFLEKLSHSIHAIYEKNKKCIKKLQKYLTNRTLKGNINYLSMNKHVQTEEARGRKKKIYIYTYTFHTIEDNFFMERGKDYPEGCLKGPSKDHILTKSKLFQKVKKILTECKSFNQNVRFNFVEKKLEKVCLNMTDLLTWYTQFRLTTRWNKRNGYICVYFFKMDISLDNSKKDECKNDSLVNHQTGHYYESTNLHNTNKNVMLNISNQNKMQLICTFHVASPRNKMFKITRKLCVFLFTLSHKYEKFPNLDLLYMLRHVHHAVRKFPYLYIWYAEGVVPKRFFSNYVSDMCHDHRLRPHARSYFSMYYQNLFSLPSASRSVMLKFLKRKRKKMLRKFLFKGKEFSFLQKMHKILLYFYLYILRKLFKKLFNCKCAIGCVRRGKGINNKDKKEVHKKGIFREGLLRNQFDEFIKRIKMEKKKKKIYSHFRNCVSTFLSPHEKDSCSGEEVSGKLDTVKEEDSNGKQNKNFFVLKPVFMDRNYWLSERITSKWERTQSKAKYEKVSDSYAYLYNSNNHSNNCARTHNDSSMKERDVYTFTAEKTYASLFSMKNMKKLVHKVGPLLIDKLEEKFYESGNFLLNVNTHKKELHGIVIQFEEEIKDIVYSMREASMTSEIITHCSEPDGTNLQKIDDNSSPSLSDENANKLLYHICKKKKNVYKNLSIFNIPIECVKKEKLHHIRWEKMNIKIVRDFFRYEKCSFEGLFQKGKRGGSISNINSAHTIRLNYLVFFVNGHTTFCVNIFSNTYKKWNNSRDAISRGKVYFLNVYKNDLMKNMFIERFLNFLEDLFSYVEEIIPVIKKKKCKVDGKNNSTLLFNVCKIFCYELKQRKYELRKIYNLQKEAQFYLFLFTLPSQAILFSYSIDKYEKGEKQNGRLCNPFFVKILAQNKHYDVFIERVNCNTRGGGAGENV